MQSPTCWAAKLGVEVVFQWQANISDGQGTVGATTRPVASLQLLLLCQIGFPLLT